MPDKKLISLTFDDGPTPGITDQILDILEQYHARASFFLIGSQITPETEYLIRREVSLGCTIENHTLTHPALPELTDAQILDEVNQTTDRIVAVTGEAPQFFRPPYIAVEDRLYDLIPLTFICGIGCQDWVPEVSTEERVRLILEAAHDGAIILVHDMKDNLNTVEAVRTVIPMLQAEGYEFVNVREIFAAKDKPIDRRVMYSDF